jgi:hypothetical protein
VAAPDIEAVIVPQNRLHLTAGGGELDAGRK